MKTMWKDDFVDGLLDEGEQKGMLKDAREKLLRLLERRFAVSGKVREQVEQCADMSTIDTWFDRAIDATSLSAVFAD